MDKNETNAVPEEARARHEALTAEIERHEYLYRQKDSPVISDMEFDALEAELKSLEEDYPALRTPDSPTQRVGGALQDGFKTVTHDVPMLSIDNTYSADELRAFDERVQRGLGGVQPTYVVEPKIDGVAISLRFENGKLTRAATRGDGARGDDVTQNIRALDLVPETLKGDMPELLEVRGEVFMRFQELKRLNELREQAGQPLLANPRNATAGTLKLLDSAQVAKRRLSIFLYDVAAGGDRTHFETLQWLEQAGLDVNPGYKRCKDINAVIDSCDDWRDKRHDLDYAIDGLVIKVDDPQQRQRLGSTAKSPRWVIAYKFPAEVAQAVLRDIEVQVGKSGALTPVARLASPESFAKDPDNTEGIPLAGTIVSNASLYNFDDLARKDLRIGDVVEVQKAGEIIPQVLRYVPDKRPDDAKPFPIPQSCPACDGAVHKDPDGVFLRCLNVGCPAQVKERLAHFASRNAMDIEGLGDKNVERLVELDLLKTPADIYTFDMSGLPEPDGFGAKSVENLAAAIEDSKTRPLSRLLGGLGIRHVGAHVAEVLARHFKTMDNLMNATKEDLCDIHEVGDVVAASVRDFFDTEENRHMVERLKEAGVGMEETTPSSAHRPFDGKTFVVTGTLDQFSRKGIQDRIKELGGRPTSSVSANTDYVIAGANPGSKFNKAAQLGVPILTEQEFLALVEATK